jgi:lysylphosphatidylglycerol synthetase-like protein (DUF2156 family)
VVYNFIGTGTTIDSQQTGQWQPTKGVHMAIVIVAALLVLLFFGLGFAIHFLWLVAVVFFILWLVGFAVGRGEGAGRRGWYGR